MSVQIVNVSVEHHHNGFAIFHSRPRISCRFGATPVKGWTQASYTLIISRGGNDETYEISSSESVLVPWPSSPLSSREVANIRVRATGKDGSQTNWATLDIEVALLEPSQWKARLISGPRQPRDEPKPPFRVRKTFNCSATGPARLYATSHGIYQVEINGKVVGDELLTPGWQSYKHRLHYQAYDVTPYLVKGENDIGAYVAEGWYAGRLGRPGVLNNFGDRLSFLGQVEVAGEAVCITDQTWDWLHGPVLGAEIYNGETFDSALDDVSWSTTDTSAKPIGKVEEVGFPEAGLIAPDVCPVRRVMGLSAKELIITPSGKKILDFGQNLVDWLKILVDIPGNKGDKVVIRHAEVLENGELGTRPLRTARAENIIHLGGKTKDYESRFSWYGFRYAEISGYDKLSLADFKAIVISTDLRRTGTFQCSHDLINKLHENTIWSTRGNFVSVPTDCPQHDERLGWTGDIQVFALTANYLFDTSAFLGAWLRDLEADQRDTDGIVPVIVPKISIPPRHPEDQPKAVWADCSIMTPWDLYTSFGDKAILETQWESMRLWLDEGVPWNEEGFYKETAIQFGDWLDPCSPPQLPGHSPTDPFLVANAYLIHVTRLAGQIATLLNKPDAAAHYIQQASDLTQEFRTEYITRTGRLACDTQAVYILALLFNLFETDQEISTAKKRLDHLIRWEAFKITTGSTGTPVILHAYRMLQERDCPSWLYPVGMGATTIWERWNSMLEDGTINPGQMTSFNHYALGSVCAFLHKTVGGLSPTLPGWKSALVAPKPGGTVRSAKTSFDSPYGPYAVEWSIKDGKMKTKVGVPPNGEARVVLEGVDEAVGSGEWLFETKWVEDAKWPPQAIQVPQGNAIPSVFVP
ncbi:hypothetical protein CC80DRAFT_564968 [Byssothecium circinans]|uniref:alpha-L-rhamnosidase n=1 Tax=Byssothecium circinans TaxID=147558 RepID=A0A6A5TR16_9PLEO|nr:hypothetical protein CC80DRAFT_564968 [Byssothecium circinans]